MCWNHRKIQKKTSSQKSTGWSNGKKWLKMVKICKNGLKHPHDFWAKLSCYNWPFGFTACVLVMTFVVVQSVCPDLSLRSWKTLGPMWLPKPRRGLFRCTRRSPSPGSECSRSTRSPLPVSRPVICGSWLGLLRRCGVSIHYGNLQYVYSKHGAFVAMSRAMANSWCGQHRDGSCHIDSTAVAKKNTQRHGNREAQIENEGFWVLLLVFHNDISSN